MNIQPLLGQNISYLAEYFNYSTLFCLISKLDGHFSSIALSSGSLDDFENQKCRPGKVRAISATRLNQWRLIRRTSSQADGSISVNPDARPYFRCKSISIAASIKYRANSTGSIGPIRISGALWMRKHPRKGTER